MSDKEINKPHDQVERKNQGDRTSESTSKDSVISGDRKDHQAMHQEASKAGHTFDTFSDNNHDQSFKAIQPAADTFGIDFGDGTIETSKGKVAKVSEQLIAANLTPDSQIRSKSFEPNSAEVSATDVPKDSIAWGEDKMIPRVTMPSGDRAVFPYRGMEDFKLSECTKDDPKAWNSALEAYPKLQKYLGDADAIKLMKGLVRNELHWFDIKDRKGDNQARAGNPDYDETLGYAQITPRGVNEFETGMIRGQQVRPPDSKLAEFLENKGYTGKGHEAKALEDPSCTPMIVAAKLNTLIQLYEKTGTAVNPRTLAYGYNADVYYNPNQPDSYHSLPLPGAVMLENRMGNKKAFPVDSEKALNASTHLKNVEEQMKLIH